MYTLYTDKSENFKCNIGVEGASIKNTTARLVLENANLNILFEGTVSKDGNCVIPIKQLKHILPEGLKGTMKLEVIADDTFFSPWQDDFEVKVNKKVTVEVMNDSTKKPIKESKRISVTVTKPNKMVKRKKVVTETYRKSKKLTHSEIMSKVLSSKGITLSNFDEHLTTTIPLVEAYVKRFKVRDSSDDLLNEIIINLK